MGKTRALEKVKLLWDTDLGTDIDDALCLAYLCRQKRCELVGITVTSSQPEKRAKLIKALLHSMNQPEVPVHPGDGIKLNGKRFQTPAPQTEALKNWTLNWEPIPGSALNFLEKVIKEQPKEVSLLATGPLTNIARLLERVPDALEHFKAIYLMNGCFSFPLQEYNAVLDSSATALVYSRLKNARVMGLDITSKVSMASSEVEQKFHKVGLSRVAKLVSIWSQTSPIVIFHDPLAGVCIFEPELFHWKPAEIKSKAGFTFAHFQEKGKNLIAKSIDKEKFFEHYFQNIEQ